MGAANLRLKIHMPRKKKTNEEKVLSKAVAHWTSHKTGMDSKQIASALRLGHEAVKQAMLNLEATGLANLNRDKVLNQMSFGKGGMTFKPVVCHIIFPSKEVLTENFYNSDLLRQKLPVFEERVMKGSHTYSFAYFNEEVLRKYLTRPDLYDVSDTVSGGRVQYMGEDEALYVEVRHGRRKLTNGRSAVTAFITDLLKMNESEQRYWHGHEITDPAFADEDDGFADFLDVNLDGKWISYKDPVSEALEAIKRVNERLGVDIFRRTENALLHAPVENTMRAYCDSCGEIYKLIGNDSLNIKVLKPYLVANFGADHAEFEHTQSKRPLTGLQLLELLQTKADTGDDAYKTIKSIGEDRGQAAHATTFKGDPSKIYIDMFRDQCQKLTVALDSFGSKVAEVVAKKKEQT
jgi:hypothetical protein